MFHSEPKDWVRRAEGPLGGAGKLGRRADFGRCLVG